MTFPLGMFTDSALQDIDADGLLDLIIVGDWMPITILKTLVIISLKTSVKIRY